MERKFRVGDTVKNIHSGNTYQVTGYDKLRHTLRFKDYISEYDAQPFYILKKQPTSGFKVGDVVTLKSGATFTTGLHVGTVNDTVGNLSRVDNGWVCNDHLELVEEEETNVIPHKEESSKPDGGPSSYYDFPFKDWTTVNDMVEYLAEKQWANHSWIFKDILKAVTRWGVKEGTDKKYDSKKIIYYGARLLLSVSDITTVRKYLQQLLDDKQFQERNKR